MAIEDAVTELAAEKAQRLPQGATGVRRVELGPKQRNDGVAAGTGSMNGEISEKGEALRLSEDGVDRASVGPLQVQRSYSHRRGSRTDGGRPSHAPITAGSLAGASLVNVRRRGVPARAFPAFGRGRLARGAR